LVAIDAGTFLRFLRITDIPLPVHPEGFQLDSASGQVFVNLPKSHTIAVVDRRSGKLASTWSITIAGDNARFALPEMSHQLPPLIVLSYFGKFVPFKKAFELALTSRQFDSYEAERIGIVTQVVPAGSALSGAMALAQTIANLDAEAVRLLREFARRVGGLSDDIEARNGMASMALMMSARAVREAATT